MSSLKMLATLGLGFSLLAFGCAKSDKHVSDGMSHTGSSEQDTQMQSEGGTQWTPDTGSNTQPPVHDPNPAPPSTTTTTWDQQPSASGVMGWRIQIAAMSSKDGAMAKAQEAADKLNVKGYIEPAGGLWKVRMGNARTKEEAEVLRDYARNRGYSDAWIVETTIEGK